MKKIFINSFLVVLSLIIGFLIAEFSFRALLKLRMKNYQFIENFFIEDKDLGYITTPDQNVIIKDGFNVKTHVITNNIGLRSNNIDTNFKGKNILFLGDSFTFGHGIFDVKNIFPSIVSSKLKNVQMINGGVDGYSTVQCIEMLKKISSIIKINTVILSFSYNDPWDNFDNNGFPYKVKNGQLKWLLKDKTSLIWTIIQRKFGIYNKKVFNISKKLLLNFINICNKKNIKSYIVLINGRNIKENKMMNQIALSLNFKNIIIPFENNYELLKKNIFLKDGHWNKKGHYLAAKKIIEILKNK